MKNLLTNEVVLAENGNVAKISSCYVEKTRKLSDLGFSITKRGRLSFPDCFNSEITENNLTQVLYDCLGTYRMAMRVLYYTEGGFDSEMFGWYLFELCKTLYESCIHEREFAEWLQGFAKKCIDATFSMAWSESKGYFNKKQCYKTYFFNLLNELLTRYDFRDVLNYFGVGGVVKRCRMSTGQILLTKALWRLKNEFCDISEIVTECFDAMKMLRLYTYDADYKEYREAFQKLEMTACYREISECIEFSGYWVSNS